MQKTGELTPSEQRWLRHLRRAEEQGVTLVDYARSAGVKVGSLYEARHTIARKGVQVRAAFAEDSPRKSAEFITVQVGPSTVPVAGEPGSRYVGCAIRVGGYSNARTGRGLPGSRRSSVEVHMIRPDRALTRVYLHRTPVDFRKQHQGLAALVQEALEIDPFSGSVFGFINKRRTKLRLLVWEKNGFVLWSKSLAEEKFPWPRHLQESVVTLTGEKLNWLLDGYDVWKMKPHKTLNYSYAS